MNLPSGHYQEPTMCLVSNAGHRPLHSWFNFWNPQANLTHHVLNSLASFNQQRGEKRENNYYAIPSIHEPYSHKQELFLHVEKHICSVFWHVHSRIKMSTQLAPWEPYEDVICAHPEFYKYWSWPLFLFGFWLSYFHLHFIYSKNT